MDFFNNTIFTSLFSFILGLLTCYFTIKQTNFQPLKFNIRRKQFDEVYLPLYKIIHPDPQTDKENNFTEEDLEKINKVIKDHVELIQPSLMNLMKEYNFNEPKWRDNISRNIEDEYIILKKILGYPTSSSFQFFWLSPWSTKKRIIKDYIFIPNNVFEITLFAIGALLLCCVYLMFGSTNNNPISQTFLINLLAGALGMICGLIGSISRRFH